MILRKKSPYIHDLLTLIKMDSLRKCWKETPDTYMSTMSYKVWIPLFVIGYCLAAKTAPLQLCSVASEMA